MSATMRVGVGAGFAGDRFEPATELAENADLDALVFECLAERTIALAQMQLLSGTGGGFDRRVLRRVQETLPGTQASGAVIITNAGAANPHGAATAIAELAMNMGRSCQIAVVRGDDVLHSLDVVSAQVLGAPQPEALSTYADRIVSANAYLGADALVSALDTQPDVVITGRVADASLFLAPLMHRFGWRVDDWDSLAGGIAVGHLLECAGQLTGGYFSDAVRKQVNGLATIGFPYADVDVTGSAIFRKLDGTGGRLDRATAMEQLLYEVADPRRYLTPDVVLDMTAIELVPGPEPHSICLSGARGSLKPESLKVSVGIRDGFEAVGEISYAGPGCIQRAKLAIDIIRERWSEVLGYASIPLDCSIIGVNSCYPWDESPDHHRDVVEVRARFAVRSLEELPAIALANDVEALYTNGPAGGGGVTVRIKEAVGIVSTLIPRDLVKCSIEVINV